MTVHQGDDSLLRVCGSWIVPHAFSGQDLLRATHQKEKDMILIKTILRKVFGIGDVEIINKNEAVRQLMAMGKPIPLPRGYPKC